MWRHPSLTEGEGRVGAKQDQEKIVGAIFGEASYIVKRLVRILCHLLFSSEL
jgi:hypothetical protein